MVKRSTAAILGCVLAVGLAPSARGGVVVYEEGDKKIEIGGRIQLQYTNADPEDGESRDRVFFRRLRPYIAGTVTKDWWGKIQADFGAAEDAEEVAVKDAFMQYRGWKNMTLTIGNSKTPFSREFLTSSKRQQLVERTFVGDHNFGGPDRQLGLKLDGHSASKKLTWALAVGAEHHDPDVRRIDFGSPVNNQSDWNEGAVIAGRLDLHPRGFMKFDQADFGSDEVKFNFSLGAYTWENDGDNNTYTDDGGNAISTSRADLDSAQGFELSAGLRGHGVSFDVQVNRVSAETVVGDFTGGVYVDGTTDLEQLAFEGGYTFNKTWEIVAGLESQDADGYEASWDRTSVGLNYYWNKHKTKVMFTYRFVENFLGERGNDQELTFLQFQFVF